MNQAFKLSLPHKSGFKRLKVIATPALEAGRPLSARMWRLAGAASLAWRLRLVQRKGFVDRAAVIGEVKLQHVGQFLFIVNHQNVGEVVHSISLTPCPLFYHLYMKKPALKQTFSTG